jgi:hypothetical protein
MKRSHLLSTAAAVVASTLLVAAGPAPAQPSPQDRATAAADRMGKNNGANGGPAELLRSAQAAMRRGQTAEANELLERAETRLLLSDAAGGGRAAEGEPARHVSEARRALMNRDRAEAMRHTNLAIASVGDGGATAAGGDASGRGGAEGGGRRAAGAVDSGMGGPAVGRAVVRDAGMAGTSVSRAEGVLLAQSTTGTGSAGGRPAPPPAPSGGHAATPPPAPGGGRGAASALPPGDTIPGWSGPAAGAAPQAAPGAAWRPTPASAATRAPGPWSRARRTSRPARAARA